MIVTAKKAKPKLNWILAVAFVAVVCYFVVCFIGLRAQVRKSAAEVSEVESEVAELQASNAELQQILDEGDLDAYVEKKARDEDLGYMYPDERVYYDMGAGK